MKSRGIYLSLGSNLGDRRKNLNDAIRILNRRGVKILKKSKIHETEPVGNVHQPRFLNMAVEVETIFLPEELLYVCLDVENGLGRIRKEKWGPRIIDIDVLLYQDRKIQTDFLTIPHPRMYEREFVMNSLREISDISASQK